MEVTCPILPVCTACNFNAHFPLNHPWEERVTAPVYTGIQLWRSMVCLWMEFRSLMTLLWSGICFSKLCRAIGPEMYFSNPFAVKQWWCFRCYPNYPNVFLNLLQSSQNVFKIEYFLLMNTLCVKQFFGSRNFFRSLWNTISHSEGV